MTVNLANAFLGLAFRWPERIAVEAHDTKLTFRQLVARAGQMANLLEKEGARPGDRIGVAMTRSDEALVAVLAIWFLDATVLLLDFRARAGERSKLAEALNVRMFVEDKAAPGADPYPAFRLPTDWANGANTDLAQRRPLAAGDAVAIIGVSSGTTGMPQPVALSHSCLFARYAMARATPQWHTDSRLLVTTPLAFSATRKHVLSRLLDGDTVIFAPPINAPDELAELALKSRATTMLTVPAIARGLLTIAPPYKPLFPEMDWLMCCGAPMLPQEKLDVRDRLSRGFVQNYGSTMAGMITLLETADIEAHSHTVGRPLPHVLVEVLDSQNRVLPPGEAGQIRVRTPAAGAELALPPGSSKRESDLLVDGWIYPGDLVILDADGFLSIVGRISDIIIRGGVNIYPGEIEEVLTAHPAVAEAAVVGWPDRIVGEELAAFVVVKSDVAPQQLVAWCRSRLQPDKQPREIFLIERMPRNANGKLVRRDLADRLPKR